MSIELPEGNLALSSRGFVDHFARRFEIPNSEWIDVGGWLLILEAEPLIIQVGFLGSPLITAVRTKRADIGGMWPSLPHAARSGFEASIELVNAPSVMDGLIFVATWGTGGSLVGKLPIAG